MPRPWWPISTWTRQPTRKGLSQAGYQPVVAQTGREVLSQLKEHADFDLILLDQDVADPPLAQVLAQLRSDIDNGLTPVLITVSAAKPGSAQASRELALKRVLATYKNAWVLPAAVEPNSLKQTLADRIVEATGKALSDEERKANARMAMLWLRKMSVGELPGYEIQPARAAILQALRSNDLNTLAVEAAGAMTDRDSQRELATLVLSQGAAPELRAQAAVELSRHIQHNGLLLAEQAASSDLFGGTEDTSYAATWRVIGACGPTPYDPPAAGL